MKPRLWRRVFRLDVGRGHIERDVDQEIAFHLAMRADKLRALGTTPEAAPGQALARFGDLRAIRGELLDMDHHTERTVKRNSWFENMGRDIAYALRALRHHKGFSIVVILTLALGIGANSAIYSIVDALLLRAIPVAHPNQLVAMGDVQRVNSWSSGSPRTDLYSYPLYEDVRDHNEVFSGVYGNSDAGSLAITRETAGKAAPAEPDRSAIGRLVTTNYFQVLGIHAARGRVFAPDADKHPGATHEVVISDGYWARLFNRDPALIGQTLIVNNVPMTVIGVTPPAFTGDIVAQRTDLWIPFSMAAAVDPTRSTWLSNRGQSAMLLMGRLKPGITFEQARGRLVPLVQRLLRQGEATDSAAGSAGTAQYQNIPISPGARGFSYWRGTYAQSLYTLLVAVGLVLLIVCANVANLLLGRAASRAREVGVRLALGAGRGRIVQQLMVESLTLAAAGAATGLLFAWWLSHLLLRVATGGRGLPLDTRLNGVVLLYTGAISIAAALLFGLAPALRATRVNAVAVLRSQARGISGAWKRFGAGRMLVMAQVALSLVMLVATGMVVRSLHSLETSDMGLDRTHLLIVTMSTSKLQRSDTGLRVLRTELAAQVAAVPGVRAVTYSLNGIFSGTESETSLTVPGFVPRSENDSTSRFDFIGPAYFATLRTPLLRGREFSEVEINANAPIAVINQAFASKFFAGVDPIGKTLRVDDLSRTVTVVGVAANVHDHDLRAAPPPRVYLPMNTSAGPFFTIEARTSGDPAALAETVKKTLLTAQPALDIGKSTSLQLLTENSIRQDVLMARFVSAFGVLALLLAAMGLYGIMSYATSRRTGEFGLRMALGASPADIARMVLRDGLVLIGMGMVSGAPLIAVGAVLLRSQLFGVGSFDPMSIGFALGVLAGCALLAGLLPAARAARVGPMVALQTE